MSPSGTFAPARQKSIVAYLPFFFVVAGHVALVYALAVATGLEQIHYFGLYSQSMVGVTGLTIVVLLALYLARLLFVEKEKAPSRRMVLDARRYLFNWRNILAVVPCMVALPIFIASFTSFKSMMSLLNPFQWDPTFAAVDRFLHGGVDPWRLSHALFGSTEATYLIGGAYFIWFPLLWGFFIWHVIRLNRPADRHQFLLCFVLCWSVIGSVMAYFMISGGPCFYGQITGDTTTFAPLMERLRAIDLELAQSGRELVALKLQNDLWTNLSANTLKMGMGISAMPSMHVSISVLMALAAWRYHRGFGVVMALFALFIQIGSVHLAWHYAIDGYLAAAVTIGLWWLSGWIVRRLGVPERQVVPASSDLPAGLPASPLA